MKVGFTGRASEPTDKQKVALESALRYLKKKYGTSLVLLHNDGVGADQLLVEVGSRLGIEVEATGPDTPMKRNRALVSKIGYLLAVLPTYWFIKSGSGTWATVVYAWKAGLKTMLIFPSGLRISVSSKAELKEQ